jgi:hypothetical protein
MRGKWALGPLLVTAGLAMAAGGCGFDPEGDVPMDPPPIYHDWWAKTEACSGLKGNFDRVTWSVIEGRSFRCASGQCAGHWDKNHHIYLASEWAMDEMVVRHEMLHDMIGMPGHPAPPFGEGCPLTWDTWDGGTTEQGLAGVAGLPKQID